jgi:hypothetical protein
MSDDGLRGRARQHMAATLEARTKAHEAEARASRMVSITPVMARMRCPFELLVGFAPAGD